MQVDNYLEEKSFLFSETKENMLVRGNEICEFLELVTLCQKLKEPINYNDDIWYISVEEGVSFWEWIYEGKGKGSEDIRAGIREWIGKRPQTIRTNPDVQIAVALGMYDDLAYNVASYFEKRRGILSTIKDTNEFADFMKSCFMNSVFADDIESEMKYIKDFPLHTEEIVKNLSVLNDEAIDILKKCNGNPINAMEELSTKLIECSPDPKHASMLVFDFSYEVKKENEYQEIHKQIECQPHLKLIRKNSDLRIYFFWKDKVVGEDKKVLIGRIGRHPY